jgi:hypothetical protein
MNKLLIGLALPLALALTLYGTDASAQMGYGQMGPGYYGMGPGMMGYGYGMGPGMMGYGYGPMGPGYYGMGRGMMGYGYGMGPGMMGYGYGPQYGPQYAPQYQRPQKPLTENQAKQLVENYLQAIRNPNLKLGKIVDKGNAFEANIVTKDGSLVNKVLVDKNTGWMQSAY